MLFDATLRRELARSFGATLVVILTIVITMMLIRTLGLAARRLGGAQDVVLLLGYTALGHLPTMLACRLFVAVVVTLGRMYRDSEMAIWFASGIGLAPLRAAGAAHPGRCWWWWRCCCCSSGPGATASSAELRDRYEQRSDLSRVAPGVFQSLARRPARVLRRARQPTAWKAQRVRADTPAAAGESVVSARSGRCDRRRRPLLVLEAGQRTDVDSQSGVRTLSSFERYRVLVGQSARPHRRRPRAQDTAHARAAARAHAAPPGRAGLARGHAAGHGQPAAAGRGPGATSPAPRQQLEPAASRCWLRRLFQPRST
jgi:lipopolysaccharide export system permease protein